jgi:hypothetical protein
MEEDVMKRTGLLLVVAFVAACSSGSGGSSGSGSGGGNQVACVTTSGNGTGCTILKDLSPAAQMDATKNCQGTIETDCPTAGLVGCCSIAPQMAGQVPQEICFYSGSASSLQSNCSMYLHGSWSSAQ